MTTSKTHRCDWCTGTVTADSGVGFDYRDGKLCYMGVDRGVKHLCTICIDHLKGALADMEMPDTSEDCKHLSVVENIKDGVIVCDECGAEAPKPIKCAIRSGVRDTENKA